MKGNIYLRSTMYKGRAMLTSKSVAYQKDQVQMCLGKCIGLSFNHRFVLLALSLYSSPLPICSQIHPLCFPCSILYCRALAQANCISHALLLIGFQLGSTNGRPGEKPANERSWALSLLMSLLCTEPWLSFCFSSYFPVIEGYWFQPTLDHPGPWALVVITSPILCLSSLRNWWWLPSVPALCCLTVSYLPCQHLQPFSEQFCLLNIPY